LFLVFGYLAKVNKSDERRWLAPVAAFAALSALVGGLTLAYLQIPKPVPPSAQTNTPPEAKQRQTDSHVQQTSTGQGSPNVQGVQGDVTVTVDQSKDKTEAPKPPAKTPKPENK
jgi:hypothetical protein